MDFYMSSHIKCSNNMEPIKHVILSKRKPLNLDLLMKVDSESNYETDQNKLIITDSEFKEPLVTEFNWNKEMI